MIFHLSYDFNEKEEGRSANRHTPKEDCSVRYIDIDTAVAYSLEMGERPLYYGKTDLSNAFRILPLKKESWKWLMMKAKHPETNETKYFFDKCLPFGSSISCSHFQRFSNTLKHIASRLGKEAVRKIVNYLDDFLFIGKTIEECNQLMKNFVKVCEMLNIPIANEKSVWGSIRIVFLGIMLDGEHFVLAIPEEKRQRAVNMLKFMVDAKKAKVKDMESLTGYLNFLNRAIFPGRAFTRRMYAKFTNLTTKLKGHHHVKLDKEYKEDFKMWLSFLTKDKLLSVCRPFVDLTVRRTAQELNFYSDALASEMSGGLGCVFGKHWMKASWPEDFLKVKKPSIEYLELAALSVAVFAWGGYLKHS